jgi:hypothetical protein
MKSLPCPNGEIVGRKRHDLRREQQVKEADEIYASLIFQRALVGDLIHASAKRISDPAEAADVRFELHMIVRHLAAATGHGSPKAVWEGYRHHFESDRNRELFLSRLRQLTRRVASALLVGYPIPEPKRNRARLLRFVRRTPSLRLREIRKPARTFRDDGALRWYSSLLPKSVAPFVLRLAILHPGILEHFLPRFFFRASDCLIHGSTYRRALLILSAVPEFGWSAEKHTRRLIELGEIKPPEAGSEVETVKKFIRDLRRRRRKQRFLTNQPEPRQETSSARKAVP